MWESQLITAGYPIVPVWHTICIKESRNSMSAKTDFGCLMIERQKSKQQWRTLMIKRILNSRLPLMVVTPVKVFDIKYFDAIASTGALPVYDTEFLSSEDILLNLEKLSGQGFGFGVRLATHDTRLIEQIKARQMVNLTAMVVPLNPEDEPAVFDGFGDTQIVLEIKEINIADKIKAIDPHALILKGNEAGGCVSRYSSFILMQWYLKNSRAPVFIHGGVGQYTAAGMLAAGVSGFVMDSQFMMTDEAPVSSNFKKLLGMVDESDSTEIIFNEDDIYRVFAKLGTKIVKDLKQKAIELTEDPIGKRKVYQLISDHMAELDKDDVQFIQSLFYLGQDGVFAKDFVRASTSIKEIIPAFFKTIGEHLDQIDDHDPVQPDSAFAKDQGTRFPLIQGPMANISDNCDFANHVLSAGALPFLAVGSLPASLADNMLGDAAKKVERFGAGLVGIEAFNPMVQKHLDMVKKYKLPYALFAGGIPSQVMELEKEGTKTYLHTPSVSMMENAIKNGCKRFIFEGGEAGGHVGMLSSMVLWEDTIATLVNKDYDLSDLYLVFAGGISTCFASYFISGMTSFLAARGAKIGIQVGTAYLFADEIVDTQAMKKQYRDIIIRENKTVVIGKTLGLASRTAPTEFARRMVKGEYEGIKSGENLEKRKRDFEKNQIGSLLIGAKGFLPDFKRPGEEHYTWFEDEEHAQKGNFLVGDSLAFFDHGVTIKKIHATYFQNKNRLYANLNALELFSNPENKINDEIAIVGMGCTLPDADDPDQLWENILAKKYSIREMPEDRFDRKLYYDKDRSAEDKTYTIFAGHVEHFKFDNERFGYTDEKARRLSRSQQMVLQTAYKAVENAGLIGEDNRLMTDDPSKTAVIIATCLSNELGNALQFKYWYPEIVSMMENTEEYHALTQSEQETVKQTLLEGMEGDCPGYDPVHGILLNIEASRIAHHLGARGANYVVDAACASSVTALKAAAGELLSGEHDQVIVGGVNTHLAPESFIGFSNMGTLSAQGSYPFDERADGFILGEGSVVFVLKRMKDALRDKDNILGVINAIGSSSDGRGKAIAAPNPTGQVLSVQRCYERIRPEIKPEDIGFIEAHGTATIIGDQAELATLDAVYKKADAGISSIKSQIGHLLGAAGSVGLLKAVLAINKGVIPPNGEFKTLSKNHNLDDSGLYIVEAAKSWKPVNGVSRKAAVSSYGFGGINYHIVVEQMTEGYQPLKRVLFNDLSYDFNDDRIVVAGLGVFLPGAKNTEEFWERLVSGEKQLSEIPKDGFDNDAYAKMGKESHYYLPKIKAGRVRNYKFNNLKYRMPPKMVKSIERGQIFGLEAAGEALKTSGLLEKMGNASNRVGVILGTISGERQSKNVIRTRKVVIEQILSQMSGIDAKKAKRLSKQVVDVIRNTIPENNEDTTPGLLSNIISGRIANYYGLNGANYVIDASCASALIAMRNAARNLKQKEMDFVLAGGVDTNLYPAVLMAFKRLGLLSESECRFFDSRADGYVMGEGAAIHVMTTYRKAREYDMEILGEINECAVRSSVPDHLLAPSEHTFVSTINEAYEKCAVRKRDIQHLDLFAFSNIFGDLIEKQVIENCFNHEMNCGNIKSQFGYFKAANPAVAMAKMLLMNKKKQLLPDFNYDPDHSVLNDSKILKPLSQLKVQPKNQPLRFASNVNGIGGNHCHMIMGTLPRVLERQPDVIEAEFKAAAGDDIVLVDHAYSSDKAGRKLRMVALLSGQGAQRSRMMKDLFEKDDHIRRIMERGEAIFKEMRGYSLLEMMFGSDNAINSTQNTQPAVFLSSAAIYSRLSQEGFSPDYFIGHSVGEYTALFCCGILGFDDAMRLIIKRSDLMYETTLKVPGKIMVVFKNEQDTASLIRESFVSNIYITNKNSEKQTAVSGKAEDIEKFCAYLTEKEVFFKKLNLTGAFHTPLLKDASDELREYLVTLKFNEVPYGRIVSNTYARPYPERPEEVKDLLAKQIISPVEFIKSIEYVYDAGRTHFVEIGPSRLLVNLLKNIHITDFKTIVSVDAKDGEVKSFERCRKYLADHNSLFEVKTVSPVQPASQTAVPAPVVAQPATRFESSEDFKTFKENNARLIDQILYKEFERQKREHAISAMERYNFNTNRIMISGVSVGLPGKARRVFSEDNFDAILNGENFIESLPPEIQDRFIDKNITKLFKQPDGNARFVQITKAEDVIHLAGQLGYFDLSDEYGIKEKYDIVMGISIAAGIEALKDANIPLVMQYKKVNDGKTMIPDGFALPEDMQEDTGVILTSLWPNGETIMTELENYLYEKFFLKPYEEFENIYYFLMERVQDLQVKEQLTEWFFKAKSRKKADFKKYKFDRDFLANACPLGSAHLAKIIKAKGPNTIVSSACASTTLAIGIAEDWIRVGRCKRVLVVGGENATSETQSPWVGSGFLALGAATIKKRVSEAAKPFDDDRNGTILGAGAVGLVIESASCVSERGMNGQCEILGTHIANSAYHTYNIDVPHMAREMKKFIDKVERQNNLRQVDYADKLLFMSHETYTPARGGSADAEVTALKTAFPDHLNDICISNTKGMTGHTLGAAIEDVVLVKALQKRKAPPVVNLKKVPAHFKQLNFSGQSNIDSEYGLHLSAGFGSHFAFMFVKREEENPVEGNEIYQEWVKRITGSDHPELKMIDNTLCAVAGGEPLPKVVHKEKTKNEPDPPPSPAIPVRPAPAAAVTVQTLPASAPTAALPAITTIKAIIAEQTGYTADMLEDDLDLEADLGIDTVKQVEIFGKVAGQFGFSVPDDLKLRDLNTIAKLSEYVSSKAQVSDSAPAAMGAPVAVDAAPVPEPDTTDVLAKIKDVIAEQTGYTADMLEDDLDLEADLGIDTVKQVEIFGKVAGQFGFSVPDDLKLRDLNTIAKLSEYVSSKTQVSDSAPTAVQAPVAVDAAPVPEPDTTDVLAQIKDVIAEQTGYTADMLEDDLDLEADLGIDTVKQVEIFGKVAGQFGFSVPDDLKLRDLNTIAKLSDYIQAQTADTPLQSVEPVSEAAPAAPIQIPAAADTQDEFPDPMSPIKRLIVRAKESRQWPEFQKDFKGKTLIVSMDSHGFAKAVIKQIKEKKGRVITIGNSKGVDETFDLTDVKGTQQAIETFKQKYPDLDGFIHLAPLDYYFDRKNGHGDSDDSLNTTIKSFFVMIKSLFEVLNKPGTLIGTITFDSVVFPYMDGCGDIHPMFGGLSGMLKTVNKELAHTMVKVVDFSYKAPKKSIKRIADLFLNELTGNDPRCEVGYKNKKRYVVAMKPSIADRDQPIVNNGDTLLVTGGAGGITYEIIKKVVDLYKVNLVILDINDIYSTDSKFLDKASSQAELMGLLKAEMPGVKPVEIKRALDRLMRVRQSIDNIEYLVSKGITVDYNCVDVTDFDAVKAAVDKHDRIDGIFHAAGMEMSQFIAKKELWSFELVVDVKVKGMRNLLQAFENRDYKYFFTFSSVTARFGNEGQVDYTSANDYLGKMLFKQQQHHPDRAYKVYAWTAWDGVGMATNPTVKAVLEERGLQFLPMEQGVKFFMADLLDRSESEMVFSGIDYSFDKDGLLGDPSDKEFPFLDDPVEKTDDSITYSRVLDIERDVFLHDHTMGDVPLFLGSTGVETMAEISKTLSENRPELVKLNDFQIPYGIKLLKGRPKELLITAKKIKEGQFDCTITSLFKNPKGVVMGAPKLHYQGRYTFAEKPLESKRIQIPEFRKISWTGDFESLVYDPKRLFMFGLFGTITDINSFDGETLITTVEDFSDKEFFKGVKAPRFVAAPVLVDAMFQTGGLLEFFTTSRTVLPYRIKAMLFYADVKRHTPYYCITQKINSGDETNTYDLKLVDKKGNVYIHVDGFEMVKLNRLAPEDQIVDRVEYTRSKKTASVKVD
jgi:acyl transferase domain-containing protein/NAD(P)H-dependent flavin oxidoreductase YrpB (nitropropane dioxygenase family)/acyl carrier protein/NAD(P)-dependent dehydrogenase (short-subunit alcohol dehydrogenase family)